MRSELIHVSRLSELGQMVSGLAHELNQPLTAIHTYIEAGQKLAQTGQVEKACTTLQKAAQATRGAATIIRHLHEHLRKSDSSRTDEDLASAIEQTIELVSLAAARHDFTIVTDIGPDATRALINKIQIQQVLLNLIRNALEAMAGQSNQQLTISTSLTPQGMIQVSVKDNGPGLPPTVRAKLFQPFVTTKSEGMGIGLSISDTIIRDHGGRIWMEDAPGGGTNFLFTLPAKASA